MVTDAKTGRWLEAARALWTLGRLYPKGLQDLLYNKIARTVKGTSMGMREEGDRQA